jgi:hypothetical protein
MAGCLGEVDSYGVAKYPQPGREGTFLPAPAGADWRMHGSVDRLTFRRGFQRSLVF